LKNGNYLPRSLNTNKKKKKLYNILANLYYLSDETSKAISRDYLVKYAFDPLPIFVMKKDKVIHHHFSYRKFNSMELFEILEATLKAKNLPPTGLDISCLPDQDWMRNAILHVDPTDPHQLLRQKKLENENFTIRVNEE